MIEKGKVTLRKGETNRYDVESFGGSHDSLDCYLVDLNLSDFGCGCAHWDYRLRPIWKKMRRRNEKPDETVYCKHIKAVINHLEEQF